MFETRTLALMTREAFSSAFKLGDSIPFAKRKGSLTVVEFTERGMRVASTGRAEGYLLDFDKLGVVVKDFGSIPSAGAHAAVGGALKRHGLTETSTETILYAAAKEFLIRSGMPKGSRPTHDSGAITESMNRISDRVDTRADEFLTAASRRTLRNSEW